MQKRTGDVWQNAHYASLPWHAKPCRLWGTMIGKTVTRAELYVTSTTWTCPGRPSLASVELVLKEITGTLEKGESVKLASFGTFVVRKKNQRMGRNPKTGPEVPISPASAIVFKPSAILKQRITRSPAPTPTSTCVLQHRPVDWSYARSETKFLVRLPTKPKIVLPHNDDDSDARRGNWFRAQKKVQGRCQ